MGRITELDRNKKKRKRRAVVYIVCEGKETEPKYFNRFRTRYCPIEIISLSSQYRSADKLVQKVKSTLGKNEYYPQDGDSLWCVFDRDDNSNEVLRKAYEIAKKEGYHIIYSNPCFEFWYLLHFTNYTGYLENCEAVIAQLDKPGRLEKYKKSKDVFEVLKGLQEDAIKNASRQIEKLEKEHKKFLTRESNPATNVFELVTYLNQQIKL